MSKRLTDNEFHTKENKERACYIQEPRLQAIYEKLFELEDIEEELGIDLITLFNASKNGAYVKETQYSRCVDYIDGASLGFGHNGFYFYDAKNRLWNMFFKDYGKTWALTKEELK